jgi:hypothetical protein
MGKNVAALGSNIDEVGWPQCGEMILWSIEDKNQQC